MDLLIYFLPITLFVVSQVLGVDQKYRTTRIIISSMALILITFFSALRGDIGFDWQTYRYLFDGLRNVEFVELYNSNFLNIYEPGFRIFAALIVSGSWKEQSILVITSVFLTIAVLLALSTTNITHRANTLSVWILFVIFPIYFGQVRQGIALTFMFISIYLLNKSRPIYLSLIVAFLAPLFQLSSLIYVMIIITSLNKRLCVVIGKSAYIWGFFAYCIALFNFNIIGSMSLIFPKAVIYAVTTTDGKGHLQTLVWITIFAIGCKLSSKLIDNVSLRSLTISSLFYSVISISLFSGTYAVFSRTLSFSSFFLGLISSYALIRRTSFTLFYSLIVSITALYYAIVQIIFYWDDFIPYKFFFD